MLEETELRVPAVATLEPSLARQGGLLLVVTGEGAVVAAVRAALRASHADALTHVAVNGARAPVTLFLGDVGVLVALDEGLDADVARAVATTLVTSLLPAR